MAAIVPAASDQTSMREAIGDARAAVAADDAAAAGTTGAADDAGADTALPGAGAAEGEIADFIENATAEELEAIKADPRLSKVHASMLRDYKAKTTEVATRAKALEESEATVAQERDMLKNARALYDGIRDNPKGVIKAIAERNGLTLKEAEAVVDDIDPELSEMFGDEAGAVKPLFDKAVEKRAKAVVDAALGPVLKHINDRAVETMKQDIASDLKAFGSELKEQNLPINKDIEVGMVKFSKQLEQAEGVSTREYVRMLYTLATANKSKSEVTREVSERMARAARGNAPRDIPTGAATSGTAALDPKLSFRDSLRVAREEIKAGR